LAIRLLRLGDGCHPGVVRGDRVYASGDSAEKAGVVNFGRTGVPDDRDLILMLLSLKPHPGTVEDAFVV
jgi:hypothetical protein